MQTKFFDTVVDKLVENGYIVLDNALDEKLLENLFLLSQNDNNYRKAGISSSDNFHLDSSKRSDKTMWIDEDASFQSDYLSFCNELKEYLNRTLYLGLNYYESHFAIYEKGDFYEKHLDAFRGSKNRIVTTVLYLNEEWTENDGGELVIYDEDDKQITKVIPKRGTLVIFLSDKFPHEVLPTNKKRHSIAGWFRVDT